jgi:hypothetical protein
MEQKSNTSAKIRERPIHWKLKLQPLVAYSENQHLVDNYCACRRRWGKILHCIYFCMGLIMVNKNVETMQKLLPDGPTRPGMCNFVACNKSGWGIS